MKKFLMKICFVLAFSASTLAFAFLGAGCGENGSSEKHTHTITEYYDKTYHKQECSECHAIINEGEHILDAEGECLICSAFSGAIEPVYYEEVGNYARVVDCQNTNGRVRILSTYNGLPVTEIADEAFKEKN